MSKAPRLRTGPRSLWGWTGPFPYPTPDPGYHPAVHRQRRPTLPFQLSALLLLVFGLALGACDAAPSNTPTSSPSTGPTDVPGTSSEPSSEASLPTQTDTEWGRIWDAVPPIFPRPPGSLDAEPIERAATSADLSVPAGPDETVDFFEGTLASLGYRVSSQGPAEDGSWVIDAGPGGDCKVQVTVKPLSGVTHVTILYGAACPFG